MFCGPSSCNCQNPTVGFLGSVNRQDQVILLRVFFPRVFKILSSDRVTIRRQTMPRRSPPRELGRDKGRSPSSRVGQGHNRGRSATRRDSPSRPCGLMSQHHGRHDSRPPPRELGRERRRSPSREGRQRTSSPRRGRSAKRRDIDSPSRPRGLMSPSPSRTQYESRPPPSELDRRKFDQRQPVKRTFTGVNVGLDHRDRGDIIYFTLLCVPHNASRCTQYSRRDIHSCCLQGRTGTLVNQERREQLASGVAQGTTRRREQLNTNSVTMGKMHRQDKTNSMTVLLPFSITILSVLKLRDTRETSSQ